MRAPGNPRGVSQSRAPQLPPSDEWEDPTYQGDLGVEGV